MTIDIGRQWLDAWNSHDVERVLACLTTNAVYEDLALNVVNRGHDEARQFILAGWAAFPDMRFDMTGAAISGDHGTVEWTMSGTHRGDFPGLPATGRSFIVRGVSVLDLAGDGSTIQHVRDYWDFATVLRQLGFIPEPTSA
jgi:steroid delta-isomerase-like uncharacterized protein